MTTLAEVPALNTSDTCDRCGAPAFIRVELSEQAELLFCAHHGRLHEAKLREVAVSLRDRSGREIEPGALSFAN